MSDSLIHGSCVAIGQQGVLLLGASGSGKSDLALRLMDRGALLVGDDYLVTDVRDTGLWVKPAQRLAGMIEVRNVGLCTTQHINEARIALVVRLDAPPQRLPEDETEFVQGIGLPRLILNAYEASAPIKVEWALQHQRSSV